MTFFTSPSFFGTMAWLLAIVGGVGLVSLVLFPTGRRAMTRTLAVLFVLAVAGSGALAWGGQKLRAADRDLSPSQQAALAAAIARYPDVRIVEVLVAPGDREANALAREVAAAIQAARGAAPPFREQEVPAAKGVVLTVHTREGTAGGALHAIGRTLMAARIATISDVAADLPDDGIRVVVGQKP